MLLFSFETSTFVLANFKKVNYFHVRNYWLQLSYFQKIELSYFQKIELSYFQKIRLSYFQKMYRTIDALFTAMPWLVNQYALFVMSTSCHNVGWFPAYSLLKIKPYTVIETGHSDCCQLRKFSIIRCNTRPPEKDSYLNKLFLIAIDRTNRLYSYSWQSKSIFKI